MDRVQRVGDQLVLVVAEGGSSISLLFCFCFVVSLFLLSLPGRGLLGRPPPGGFGVACVRPLSCWVGAALGASGPLPFLLGSPFGLLRWGGFSPPLGVGLCAFPWARGVWGPISGIIAFAWVPCCGHGGSSV